MLKQYPILRGLLFAVLFILLTTGADHFQGIGFTANLYRHVFVGIFTGLLLYFWQFRKAAQAE